MLCASGGLTFGLRPNASGLRTGPNHTLCRKSVKTFWSNLVLSFVSMRLLLQKVTNASVTVDDQIIGSIGEGYLVFLCIQKGDAVSAVDWLIEKVLHLRLYATAEGENKATLLEKGGEILLVSQFTLAARMDRGTKPDFTDAAAGPEAKPLYEYAIDACRRAGVKKVETGIFGASMLVQLTNDGPYTLWLER
jgi:D-tyrosyl-tRNA(Tyr) deacylase